MSRRLFVPFKSAPEPLYLYNSGDTCSDVTGGWTERYGFQSTVPLSGEFPWLLWRDGAGETNGTLQFTVISNGRGPNGYSKAGVVTVNPIDVSDYTTLNLNLSITSSGDVVGATLYLDIIDDPTTYENATHYVSQPIVNYPLSNSNEEVSITFTPPVGSHYISIQLYCKGMFTVNISEIWLS